MFNSDLVEAPINIMTLPEPMILDVIPQTDIINQHTTPPSKRICQNQRKQPRQLSSLKSLCISKICDYSDCLPSIDGIFPEELTLDIIKSLITQKKLTDTNLPNVLDSNLTFLNLALTPNISKSSFIHIINKCKKLTYLSVSACPQLTLSEMPTSQIVHSNLKMLDLSSVEISDATLLFITQTFPNLEHLKFSGRKLTNSKPFDINDFGISNLVLPRLKCLEITDCNSLTCDGLLALLKNCSSHIEYLRVSNCKKLSNSFDSFEQQLSFDLPNIKKLDFSRCNFLQFGFVKQLICASKNVKYLNLELCEEIADFTFEDRQFEASLSNLGYLNLSKTQITDFTVAQILRISRNLKFLRLKNCRKLQGNFGNCLFPGKLVELDLSGCVEVLPANLFPHFGTETFAELQKLSLEECVNVGENILNFEFLTNFKNLKILKIGYFREITEAVLGRIANANPFLIELDVSYCGFKNFDNLQQNLKEFKNLKVLNLKGISCIQGKGIQSETCEKLNLSWNKNLEDSAIQETTKLCPKLRFLDLSWCSKSTLRWDDSFNHLKCVNVRGCSSASREVVSCWRTKGVVLYI